ncbi:unnamed protein product [Linum tenue]|uniref:NAC domain-containing protein n=1 Tax=Linum tenue TaxID=586396 RepID=A0AAV0IIR2_9ROSI|nr:unnamed protein product [Linum tenue]
MEKGSPVAVNGGVKLPIGYRFRPTEEELIVHYLKRKVFGLPLPASVIPELDVFHSHPSTLPGNSREKRYFFCKREASGGDDNGEKNGVVDSSCGRGYWKHTGKDRHMILSAPSPSFNCQLVGMRRSLVFRRHKKASANLNNQWVVHEFSLLGLATIPFTNQVTKVKLGDWVLCTVFERKKKRRPSTTTTNKSQNLQGVNTSNSFPVPNQPEVEETITGPNDNDSSMDFRMEELSDAGPIDLQEEEDEEEGPCSSSSSVSPCSSGITELSSPTKSPNGGLDHQEEARTSVNVGLCSASSSTTSSSYSC